MAKLIKIDRNGSKHYEGAVKCDRCGGTGIYKWGAVINGVPQYAGTCFKCEGEGQVISKWIERTPEYQAKLDARRAKRQAERLAKIEAERLEREKKEEEARLEREARIKAQKAISQYIGEVGERMTIKGTFVKSAWFEVDSFGGYGTSIMHIHTFKDADGNKVIWKTTKALGLECGEPVQITGRVKEHSEYKDEKQTVLTRCKVEAI